MLMNRTLYIAVLVAIVSTASADDAVWIAGGTAHWNDDANWLLGDGTNQFPDAGFDDTPVINNGGIAFLDEPAVGNDDPFSSVTVGGNQGGGLEIRNGGKLVAATFSLIAPGFLSLEGDGALQVTGNAELVGTTRISGPNVDFSVGGDLTLDGTLEAIVNAPSHSAIQVAGAANVSGVLHPVFDGIQPKLGDAWPLIDAGSVVGQFTAVDTAQLPKLDAGVIYSAAVNVPEGNIDLVVTNTLELLVNRRTGTSSIRNLVGEPIALDNYAISSPAGLLDAADGAWSSLADSGGAGGGWSEDEGTSQVLRESRAAGPVSIAVGEPVDLGSPVVPMNFAPENIEFSYSSEGITLPGIVTYEGIPLNLVLSVDPDTGMTEITNQATVPIEFDGYAVFSDSGVLRPADGSWNSLSDSSLGGAGWEEANPNANAVAELNPVSTTTLGPNESVSLGALVDPSGAQDLAFSYFLAGATPDLRDGFVAYGFEPAACQPANALLGDLDGNGTVEFADFLVLADNFGLQTNSYADGDVDCNGTVAFADFLALADNFGKSLGATAAAVPEPATGLLIGAGCCVLASRRRRRD